MIISSRGVGWGWGGGGRVFTGINKFPARPGTLEGSFGCCGGMRGWGWGQLGAGAVGGGLLRAESWVTSKVQRVHRSIDYVLCYGPGLSWDRRPLPKNSLDKNNRLGFTVRTHRLHRSETLLRPADKYAASGFFAVSG